MKITYQLSYFFYKYQKILPLDYIFKNWAKATRELLMEEKDIGSEIMNVL